MSKKTKIKVYQKRIKNLKTHFLKKLENLHCKLQIVGDFIVYAATFRHFSCSTEQSSS